MEKVIERIKQITNHKYVKIVNSGNAAILAAMWIVKNLTPKSKKGHLILIPDQGSWISFWTYPKMLGLKIKEVKTERGIIDLKALEKEAKKADAFFVTSFAGYYAEQDMKKISEICRKGKCILVEDASGAVGDGKLCDGRYSDIIVASFGKGKIVNLGNGGFISTDRKEYFESISKLFSALDFNPDEAKLIEKLDNAGKRVDSLARISENIKKELAKEGIEVFHKGKRGINVVVGFKNSSQKEMIINYCSKHGYEYVLCPKDIRVKEDAISIEVKRALS